MRKFFTACLAGAVACTIAFGAVACESRADVGGKTFGDAMFTVKAGSVAYALDISDTLFGLFLEDINYASYALDDNMVANGNFEALSDNSVSAFGRYWSAQAGATFSVEATGGLFDGHADYHSAENGTDVVPHYAKIAVQTAGGGIVNSGYQYVPMSFVRGGQYRFSAFVKADRAATMTVRAADGGTVCIEETISIPEGTEWIKYERTFSSKNTCSSAPRLELCFDVPGTYCVDAVQLETADSTLGFKNYIYDAIKDLSPKFMRFPGGCIIEGDNSNTDENGECVEVYDWKNSIGAVQSGPNAGTLFLRSKLEDVSEDYTYDTDIDGTPVDLFYQSVTFDEGTGDIIVKVVNAGEEPIKANFDLGGVKIEGLAEATVLEGKYGLESLNTLEEDGYDVLPRSFTISVSPTFGYEVPAASVTAIRIHTK